MAGHSSSSPFLGPPFPPKARSTSPEPGDSTRRGSEPESHTGGTSSLYHSTDVVQLRQLHPELDILDRLGPDTCLIVSEPLRDLPGAWNEVPDGSWGFVRRGKQEIHPFEPVRGG
jgi:hypothetical protein